MSILAPGAPRPLLAEALARVADALGEPVSAADAPAALARLTGRDPSRAGELAAEILAAVDPPIELAEAVHDALGKRAAKLVDAARAKDLCAWTPTPDLPPWRWPSRPFVEAFPTAEAMLEALAPPAPIDGVGDLADILLHTADTLDGGAPEYATTARLAELRGAALPRSLRDAAARAIEAAAPRWPLTALATLAWRGWLPAAALTKALKGVKTPEERLAVLEHVVGPTRWPGEVRRLDKVAQTLIAALAKARHAPAVPVLAYLARSGDRLLSEPAVDALASMASADVGEARRELRAYLPDLLLRNPARYRRELALVLRSVLSADPARSTELLGELFTAEALASEEGRVRAHRILDARIPPGPKEPLFERDPRWLDVAVRLLDGPLFGIARAFLATFDPAAVKAALGRAGYVRPSRAAITRPLPERPRWAQRYEEGEHREVWAEIAALEGSALDPAVVGQATAVARAMMTRVRTNLERIVKTLKKHHYVFDESSSIKGLAPPDAELPAQIERMEAILGAPLPLSLRAFYEIVGAVDLGAQYDAPAPDGAPFRRFGARDPLMIVAPAMTLGFLEEDAAREERFVEELRRPPVRLFVGLDPRTKADPSEHNDRPYMIEVLGPSADGLLLQGGQAMPFVDHLRAVIAAGGFAGLCDVDDDTLRERRDLLTRDFLPF